MIQSQKIYKGVAVQNAYKTSDEQKSRYMTDKANRYCEERNKQHIGPREEVINKKL